MRGSTLTGSGRGEGDQIITQAKAAAARPWTSSPSVGESCRWATNIKVHFFNHNPSKNSNEPGQQSEPRVESRRTRPHNHNFMCSYGSTHRANFPPHHPGPARHQPNRAEWLVAWSFSFVLSELRFLPKERETG